MSARNSPLCAVGGQLRIPTYSDLVEKPRVCPSCAEVLVMGRGARRGQGGRGRVDLSGGHGGRRRGVCSKKRPVHDDIPALSLTWVSGTEQRVQGPPRGYLILSPSRDLWNRGIGSAHTANSFLHPSVAAAHDIHLSPFPDLLLDIPGSSLSSIGFSTTQPCASLLERLRNSRTPQLASRSPC